MVLSQDGIFSRAERATDKYGQAKSRETLELALSDAQMKKYENGLSDAELDNIIAKINGELLPKENQNPNLQNVIVDGYIFEIDRSVPKIVKYIGPTEGVVITGQVSGNDGWIKPSQSTNVSVTGTVRTYGKGTITNVTATKGGVEIPGFTVNDGKYEITNITSDTKIVITATDSDKKTYSKEIPVTIKVDNTAPVINNVMATAEWLEVTIGAEGVDNESGIKKYNYTITPTIGTGGIPEGQETGEFNPGEKIKIETTRRQSMPRTFIIKVTATDNCDNVSEEKTAEITPMDEATLEQAKRKVNENTLQKYIGTPIIDYKPSGDSSGIYRIFYYDSNNYFGDGAGTLYLKRDYGDESAISLNAYSNYNASDGGKIMKQMNPLWRDYPSTNGNIIDLENEHAASYLCDPTQWTKYVTKGAKYAIGAPSLEMFIKSYNTWKQSDIFICKVDNANGYSVGENNEYSENPYYASRNSLETGPYNVYRSNSTNIYGYYLSSTNMYGTDYLYNVMYSNPATGKILEHISGHQLSYGPFFTSPIVAITK